MGLPVGFARPCWMSSYVWTFPVSFPSAPVCLSASGFKFSPRCITLQLGSWDAVANGKKLWTGFPKEATLQKKRETSPLLFNFFSELILLALLEFQRKRKCVQRLPWTTGWYWLRQRRVKRRSRHSGRTGEDEVGEGGAPVPGLCVSRAASSEDYAAIETDGLGSAGRTDVKWKMTFVKKRKKKGFSHSRIILKCKHQGTVSLLPNITQHVTKQLESQSSWALILVWH